MTTREGPKATAKVRPPLKIDVELDFPVDVDGVQTDKLIVNRPTVQNRLDAEALSGTDLSVEMIMIANLCGIDPKVIKALYWSDYTKLQKAVNELSGFLPR